jgi:hypothetical protein
MSQMLSCTRSLSLAVGCSPFPCLVAGRYWPMQPSRATICAICCSPRIRGNPTELPGWVRGCPKEAVPQVLSSARTHNARGEYLAGLAYLNGCGGTASDPRAAREWLESATKAGEADAAGTLGALYQIGVGATASLAGPST